MIRVSRKTREQAATLLSTWACSDGALGQGESWNAHGLDRVGAERRLADLALEAAGYDINDDWRIWFAEAEALLRTGWSP